MTSASDRVVPQSLTTGILWTMKHGREARAFGHPHNAPWLEKDPIDSREPTPALSPNPDSEHASVNRLVLKFEQLSFSNEIRFGTSEKVSHILLKFPGVQAVSGRQFIIVVQPDFTVCLKDPIARYQTRVTQDGKVEKQVAPREHILAGQPGLPKRWNEVVIFTGNLAYTIEFPNHPAGSSEYQKKLEAFRERDDTGVHLLDALGFHSNPITAAPSQPFTPHGYERPAYLDVGKVASSTSGTVRLMKNAKDRKLYVKKTILNYPSPPQSKRKRKRDSKIDDIETKESKAHEDWFKNFRSRMKLLQTIDHPNILRVIDYDVTPDPYYITPYYKYGTLQDLHNHGIHEEMFPTILLQLLLGLRALHELGFAHRDLKEDNILVDDDFTLIFGDPDFLKSERDNALKTICGSGLYAAPEIWHGKSKNYGVSVDIWSLAICFLRLFYDVEIPSDPFPTLFEEEKLKAWNSKWHQAVLRQLNELDENNDQIIDILKLMLKLDPAERSTIDQCLERGCENGLFRKNRFDEIVLAEATEVNTEVNTPTRSSFPNFVLDGGANTSTLRDMTDISLASAIRFEEVPDDAEDGALPQLTFPSISDLPSFPLGDEVLAPEVPLSFLGETYNNPIPTIELSEDDFSCSESVKIPTAHSPATSEVDSSGRPVRRLRVSSHSERSWSWRVAISSKSGSAAGDQLAESSEEDLSRLRIMKQTFSRSPGSSFSNQKRGSSANPHVVAF